MKILDHWYYTHLFFDHLRSYNRSFDFLRSINMNLFFKKLLKNRNFYFFSLKIGKKENDCNVKIL